MGERPELASFSVHAEWNCVYVYACTCVCISVHVLMREEKEETKK